MGSKFSFLFVDIWLDGAKCQFILKNSSLKGWLFSSTFVADIKTIPDYNFVAPLNHFS